MKEYAVYKGEELLAMGTAKECAEKMGVQEAYIDWLTMPTAKRRLKNRKNPEKCTVGFRIDDDFEQQKSAK
ncbi:hypothetical protein [Radiobacillus kanasensis]|uniref:hypothetical protein n=1 Tax=Radiobacillus kanasensis TaxID=2844358 RepID=UPI0038B54BE0